MTEIVMRNLAELGMTLYGEPQRRRPPTDEEIRKLESALGARLPPAYLQFLRFANGGTPRLTIFRTKGGESKGSASLFYCLSEDEDSLDNIARALGNYRKAGGKPKQLPIGEDGFGNMVVLDLENARDAVKLVLHDEHFEEVFLADSFEDFIDGLTELDKATRDMIEQALDAPESEFEYD
jgi:hypothetical protein